MQHSLHRAGAKTPRRRQPPRRRDEPQELDIPSQEAIPDLFAELEDWPECGVADDHPEPGSHRAEDFDDGVSWDLDRFARTWKNRR